MSGTCSIMHAEQTVTRADESLLAANENTQIITSTDDSRLFSLAIPSIAMLKLVNECQLEPFLL